MRYLGVFCFSLSNIKQKENLKIVFKDVKIQTFRKNQSFSLTIFTLPRLRPALPPTEKRPAY